MDFQHQSVSSQSTGSHATGNNSINPISYAPMSHATGHDASPEQTDSATATPDTPVLTIHTPNPRQVLQVEVVRSLQQLLAQEKQRLAIQRSEDFGFEWEELSPSAGVLHDPLQRNGWGHTGYLGFPTKRDATARLRQLQRRSPQTQYQLRKARRLTTHRWEIKATGIAPELLV